MDLLVFREKSSVDEKTLTWKVLNRVFDVQNSRAKKMDKGKSTPSKRGAVFGKGGIGTVSSFLGRRPPQEIKNLVELLPRVPDTLFKRVLKFVVEHIKGTEIPSEQWQKLVQTTTEVDETGLCTLFAGLLMILKTAVRDGVEESFQSDLTELQVSAPYITLLAQARKGLYVFTVIYLCQPI